MNEVGLDPRQAPARAELLLKRVAVRTRRRAFERKGGRA